MFVYVLLTVKVKDRTEEKKHVQRKIRTSANQSVELNSIHVCMHVYLYGIYSLYTKSTTKKG